MAIKKICLTCKSIFYVPFSLQHVKYCCYNCRRHTDETKMKISLKKKEWYKFNSHPKGMLNKIPWNKGLCGIHFSPKTEFKSGKKHVFWKGGISKEPYPFEFTKDLKTYIKFQYFNICQLCEKLSKKLLVHHIDYNKKNISHKNLIPLCRSCHSKTNSNRKFWQNYFSMRNVCDNPQVSWKMLSNVIAYGVPCKVVRKL